MPDAAIEWPKKQRELHNHHFDSTVWNDFKFRDDDIVIGTYAKSGTTWVQQIVSQLLFDGAEELEVAAMSPWLDLRVPPKEVKLPAVEAQTHRRFIKTHLPVDALLFSPKARYLYIGRDGRDVIFSLYNHHANATEDWYRALNDTSRPRRSPDPAAARRHPPILSRMADGRRLSVLAVLRACAELVGGARSAQCHADALLAHEAGSARRDQALAAFLDIPIDEARLPAFVEHCSFDWMKRTPARRCPPAAPSGRVAPRPSSTRASTAAGATC